MISKKMQKTKQKKILYFISSWMKWKETDWTNPETKTIEWSGHILLR